MSDLDPIARARAIYEKRVGRKAGAIATLAGVFGAGVLGFLRFHQFVDFGYGVVALALGAGILIGPTVDRVTRRLVRRRLQAALDAETSDDDATLELRRRLRAQSIANEREAESTAWPLAKTAVLSIVGWLFPVAFIEGDVLTLVGKTMGYLAAHGGPTLAIFALAGFLQGRTARPGRRGLFTTIAILAAIVLPAILSGTGLVGMAVTAFALGLAGMFVMIPATWWMRRRALRERTALSQMVLPPSTADSDDARRLLRSTLEWDECPGPLRARALRELAGRLGAEAIGPDLDDAIQSKVPELRLAAIELSLRLHHRPKLGVLLAAAEDANAKQAALLPKLLHRHDGPQVEAMLLDLLDHDDTKVAEAAAESLGLVGTVDVVPRLKRAASRPRMARVTKQAIDRIRIRLAAAPGQLSLVEGAEAGALSDAPGAAALSVVDG